MTEYSDADPKNWPSDTYDYTYRSEYGVDERRWWDMSWGAKRDFLDKYQTSKSDNALLASLFGNQVQFKPISKKEISETLINPLAGVISAEDIAKIMPNWQEDALTAVKWNEQQFGKVLDMAYGRAAQDSEMLNALTRAEAGKMNEFLSAEWQKNIDQALPGFRRSAALYQGTVQDMLSGELPASVKQQVAMQGAEKGISRGIFGEASQNLTARDLGLSAVDYVAKGQAQMGQLTGVMQALQAPMIEVGLADTGALASQYGSSLLALTTMSPTAAVQAGGTQAQLRIGLETFNQQMLRSNQELNVNRIADWLRFNSSQGMAAQQFNAQMNYSAALSNLNYSLEQQAFEWNYKMAQMQAKAAEKSGMWGALGSIAGMIGGAALAGPVGAAIGGAIGGAGGNTATK